MAVESIGGIFIRFRDPARMAAWYETHFGLKGDGPTLIAAGPMVFSAFARDTDYFGGPQEFMINLRVDNLDATLRKLEAAGVRQVKPRETMEGIGHFGWVQDPEGNRIELWQSTVPKD